MKRSSVWLGLGLAGFVAAAGCPKSASTSTPSGSKSATAPAPSGTQTPPPAPAEEPAQPSSTTQPEQPKKAPEAPKATTTTPGGVVIEELVVGTGAECKPHQKSIKVFYKGTFKSNGKEFDSNIGDEPTVYPLDGFIAGWQEGIPGMKVGGKRKLTVPYALAYGEAGRPPRIPPRSDLVFEIELLDIK